jgi:DNA helicase HerA-like ATPase
MTGSGKTGLLTVMIEEALRASIPSIIIDVKGDLPNLLLSDDSAALAPWLEGDGARERGETLAAWSIGEPELRRFADTTSVRVLTPGSTAGESLHVLSTLERRSSRWDTDIESARDALGAAMSLVLRLLGRDPDPARSREHVILSVLAERRLVAGGDAELGMLMQDLLDPPLSEIGALSIDTFLKKSERKNLAAALNTLLASPTFATWRVGESLDVAEWVKPRNGRTPAVVVSVAHLDDEERSLLLGVLLQEILCWVRSLGGSQHLKALVVFDEVYGFLPPHPANPPTKRPLVALMKQARGFGVGVLVATQNPMDLDYRALSNAGLWFLGRLQTDADRERVLDGLSQELPAMDIDHTVQRLGPRWFVVRNAYAPAAPVLLKPRQTMTLLRGPMMRSEIRKAREWRARMEAGRQGAPPLMAARKTAEAVTQEAG